MPKLELDDIASGYASVAKLNANMEALEAAFDNTLSRDGSSPNEMNATIDMNSHRISNLGSPLSSTDAVRLIDIIEPVEFVGTPVPALTGNENKVLTTDGDVLVFANLDPYFKRTAYEISASVVPDDLSYPELDVRRYGAVGDGVTDCTSAIQTAINLAALNVTVHGIGGCVYFPKGSYLITGHLDLLEGVSLRGDGYLSSIIITSDPIVMLKFTTAANVELGVSIEHLSIIGDDTDTDDLVQFTSTGGAKYTCITFRGVRFRNTAGSCVNFTCETLQVLFDDCVFESFGQYGVEGNGLCSLLHFSGKTQVNSNATTGVAFLGLISSGAGQVTLEHVNCNGANLLQNMVRVVNANLAQVVVRGCYTEFMTGPIIKAAGTGIIAQITVSECNLNTNDSVTIDFSGAVAHSDVVIRNNSFTRNTGTCFDPGATTNYVFDSGFDSGATGVNGFSSARKVRKNRNGAAHIEDVGTYTGTLTGCTTSPTGTIRYVSEAGQVVLYIPTISGTSNATTATITGMPDAIKPARTQSVMLRTRDNGVDGVAVGDIGTNGTITLYKDVAGTVFTGSGTKAALQITVYYSLE